MSFPQETEQQSDRTCSQEEVFPDGLAQAFKLFCMLALGLNDAFLPFCIYMTLSSSEGYLPLFPFPYPTYYTVLSQVVFFFSVDMLSKNQPSLLIYY